MKVVIEEGNKYILRFDKGEDVIAGLKAFAKERGVQAAAFQAIGTTSELILSWYNVEAKQYQDHNLMKKLEIVTLLGNISIAEGEVIVHAHGSFSDVELHNRSGHVKKLVISVTCEVFVDAFSGKIEREFSPDAGLNLMK